MMPLCLRQPRQTLCLIVHFTAVLFFFQRRHIQKFYVYMLINAFGFEVNFATTSVHVSQLQTSLPELARPRPDGIVYRLFDYGKSGFLVRGLGG
jgi:hypothetical protein